MVSQVIKAAQGALACPNPITHHSQSQPELARGSFHSVRAPQVTDREAQPEETPSSAEAPAVCTARAASERFAPLLLYHATRDTVDKEVALPLRCLPLRRHLRAPASPLCHVTISQLPVLESDIVDSLGINTSFQLTRTTLSTRLIRSTRLILPTLVVQTHHHSCPAVPRALV
jgi:hypothetical protein